MMMRFVVHISIIQFQLIYRLIYILIISNDYKATNFTCSKLAQISKFKNKKKFQFHLKYKNKSF